MAFTASIEGIDEIVNSFSQLKFEKEVVKAVGSVAKELHTVLNKRTLAVYNTGGRTLNPILIGSTTSDIKRGAGFIEMGLQYESKPIPLSSLPSRLIDTNILTPFIAPNKFTPNLEGKIMRKKPVPRVEVFIKKGKGTPIKGAFRGRINEKLKVMRRKNYFSGGETWDELPTRDNLLGRRTPYYEVYGLSLSQMAATIYDKDTEVQNFKDNFGTRVGEKLELW